MYRKKHTTVLYLSTKRLSAMPLPHLAGEATAQLHFHMLKTKKTST